MVIKVHIFSEGHKFLWNLHHRFVLCSNSQIYGGYFAKFFGLLKIYEFYQMFMQKHILLNNYRLEILV